VTWRFSDFHERYNEWVETDDPTDEFRFWVMAWIFRLQDDPKVAAVLAPRLGEPWWLARIPHAENGTQAVVCLYSIEDDHVRCSGITTLSKPII
jgi:hypothetical protein